MLVAKIFPALSHDPQVIYALTVVVILALLGWRIGRSLQTIPRGIQNFAEMCVQGLLEFMEGVMGHHARDHLPIIGSAAFLILLCNLLGLLPGFMSPTSNYNTTLAYALTIFIYYHYIGFKRHGVAYIKHFTGPIWWLAPLMVPIELIGHFARPLSLSVRLFGNISGEDLVIMILAFLIPFIVPLPMMFFAIFGSFIQTFVFCLLSMIYIAGAEEEAH
ncbi:MAG: ATP synthase F0 subunit A [Nitrospinota bacterium]|nr:MAG: ATP synthase F0 subunit A [Nitrospinota bacterium]